MRRLFLLIAPLALLLGTYLGVLGSEVVHAEAHAPEPAPQAHAASFPAPATADNYLRGVLDQQGLDQATFESVAQPIVGSQGSTVYLYRVEAKDTDGHPAEAFVGITVYADQAINSVPLSTTRTDTSGIVSVK